MNKKTVYIVNFIETTTRCGTVVETQSGILQNGFLTRNDALNEAKRAAKKRIRQLIESGAYVKEDISVEETKSAVTLTFDESTAQYFVSYVFVKSP